MPTTTVDTHIPEVVPTHGIAYSTSAGLTVALPDGSVVFRLDGWRVVDPSRDYATMAAVVAPFATDSGALQRYTLPIGAASLAPVTAGVDEDDTVTGWTPRGAPDGCLRDARRAGSTLVLCALDATTGVPTSIGRIGATAGAVELMRRPPTLSTGGHWVDAIEGPDGFIAAMWSGDCESLTSYVIGAAGEPHGLVSEGGSALLGWVGNEVLVNRFGDCGSSSPADGLYRVTLDGSATRITTPDAVEAPVAW